ncbi:hypothetical protein [Ornithinimicrobium faecis]|uniref:EamA domain-containing protein n=1 Tax=Ornithinimicrobium faecis TaxID=2934158 RepID=A0ABY4YSM4_9MICO|nr:MULTISPECIES: hypothetical protein [unclassified Ornithinimicrobium]USQ79768.1 hypothetical protein NF556_19620 [Ornithinimicrobium sp. HY1793]
MSLLPGLVLVVLAAYYLGVEVLLRRRSRWSQGVLNHFRWEVLAPPVVIYLVAAVIFSVGSWSILDLTSVLIIPVLPAVVGMSWLALDPDRPVGQGVAVSACLALIGVAAVGLAR